MPTLNIEAYYMEAKVATSRSKLASAPGNPAWETARGVCLSFQAPQLSPCVRSAVT